MAHRWHTADKTSPAAQARRRQYNSREYRTAKAAGQRHVNTGHARCWRCHTPLHPGEPWHLGHDDHNRSIIRGPECVDCNLHAAAQAGARAANQQQTPPEPASYPIRTDEMSE